jgi:WD40 repeat protein
VLIDERRVLTCLAVIREQHTAATPVWVAFPKSGVARTVRRRVVSVRTDESNDLAVLTLAESAPSDVRPAPLLCPEGADLVGERWWAFGFPVDAAFGGDAHGVIGASLAYGWIRLEAESPRALKDGFLGAGIWSPRFEAVVGLLGRVHALHGTAGEAVALTLFQAGLDLPEEGLYALSAWSVLDAGESALAAWGWSLDADVEAGRHWRPRARGVAVDSEAGYRFRGRRAALSAMVGWLDRAVLDDRVLVVTGSPGVGKSAVLGRVVTTADAGIRAALPDDDRELTANVGSVACAVHVKGKTALDVAVEIARAAAVRLPREVTDLAPALRRRLADRHTPRFNLVIDALDEAVSPDQAQLIVEQIVLPIAQTCAQVGAQVIVGTRRSDDGGDLMQLFGPEPAVIDLDSEQFFEVDDLAAYALATLQLVGAERPGNPYADARLAAPVADRIAELADRNFLVASLIARRHGLYDVTPVRPDELAFPPDVDAALEEYIQRLPPVGAAPARLALTALAYAHAPGFGLELWQAVLAALGTATVLSDLEEFARSSAANFLVESTGEAPGRRFRLFHQALNDALLRERQRMGTTTTDQRAISESLIRHGRTRGWSGADRYLLRSLPEHAATGGLIDELLVDDEYLLYADLMRLTPAADYARTILGQQRARLMRLTPQAATAGPGERTAQFSVTAALEGLDARVVVDRSAPYRAAWAAVQRRLEWAILEGHTSSVNAVCALITRSHRTVLASGGNDGTIRIWNPQTGQQDRVLLPGSAVIALRPVSVDGRTLVASAGVDGVVVLWDPETGQQRHALRCEPGQICALTTVDPRAGTELGIATADGALTTWNATRQHVQVDPVHTGKITTVEGCGSGHLAAGGQDGSITMWALADHRRSWTARAHQGPVTALSHLTTASGDILASAGSDHCVRLWNADTGELRHTLRHPHSNVESLHPLTLRGRTILAAAGNDGTVRLWDPATGQQQRALPDQHTPVRDMCAVDVQGHTLLATVGDPAVRLWDPDAGDRQRSTQTARTTKITALTIIWQGNKELVACGRGDGLVQLRSTASGDELRVLTGHDGPVNALSTVFAFGDIMLASSSTDNTIGVWSLNAARQRPHRDYRPGWSCAVSAVFVHRQVFLACAGERGTIRLWDPYTGRERRRHRIPPWLLGHRTAGRPAPVSALAAIPSRSRTRIASAGNDGTVRIWNLDNGRQELAFNEHKGKVNAVCPFTLRGQTLIASAGNDQIIRIWDSTTGEQLLTLQGHTSSITALCAVTANGRLLLASTSNDGTARLWNPNTGALELTIPVHHEATACTATTDCLIVGLTAGTLAISLNL